MTKPVPITVAHGDGIGPEIMPAVLKILDAAGAALAPETVVIGEKLFNEGVMTGVRDDTWESIARTHIFFKAPITTPRGGGFKSLNVTTRKKLGLFANVRPCVSYHPFVGTKHPVMDLVVVRENEEDLYAGIEYRQSDEVYCGIKMVTRAGTERIIRYAFDYAVFNGRKKVTAFVKDNIMKFTDGLFTALFREIAKEYPSIEADEYIIDIGTARLANRPESFDVIVTQNLYGDIISDVAAEISGSIGLGISLNVGENSSMFEAIHGSAPDIAGKGIANPSGLLLAGVGMLNHIGQGNVAQTVHNAWLKTIEEGIHTGDIYKDGVSRERVGTDAFTSAVIARLGQAPSTLKAVDYSKATKAQEAPKVRATVPAQRTLIGADLFIMNSDTNITAFGDKVKGIAGAALPLSQISVKGAKIYPLSGGGNPDTTLTDMWRCRFESKEAITFAEVSGLIDRATKAGFEVLKMETLYQIDGKPGYTADAG